MRFFRTFIVLAAAILSNNSLAANTGKRNELCDREKRVSGSNNCVQFSVSSGTGCAWMCNYCASQLATNNYYFTDGVCTYQQGQGCVGNPVAGKTYTCCSV
jgi:radical SAM superfamily enzyme YgiQ (UPF0313 family)